MYTNNFGSRRWESKHNIFSDSLYAEIEIGLSSMKILVLETKSATDTDHAVQHI